jgi:hypothetical protein
MSGLKSLIFFIPVISSFLEYPGFSAISVKMWVWTGLRRRRSPSRQLEMDSLFSIPGLATFRSGETNMFYE